MKAFSRQNSIRSIAAESKQGSFQKYKSIIVGNTSNLSFILYEILTFCFGSLPGALGIFLRRFVYPTFLGSCGKNPIFGTNCIIRHPSKVFLGDNVIIDDHCLIDARGALVNGVEFGDDVIINRNVCIKTKSGDIQIGNNVTIGANSWFVSWDGIKIGDGTAIAPGCYISAGKYDINTIGQPLSKLQTICSGPIVIKQNVWIATRVTILDGVNIGADVIVSSGSIVTKNVPSKTIVSGNPAKVIFRRR